MFAALIDIHDWLVCEFGIDRNTSATILITLFVFIAGGVIGWIFTYAKLVLIRYNVRRAARMNIVDLIRDADNQARSCLNLSDQITANDENAPFVFSRSDFSQVQILREIGYEKLGDAFLSPERTLVCSLTCNRRAQKAFNKLTNTIYTLGYWQDKVTDDYFTFVEDYNRINRERNAAISNLQTLIETRLRADQGKEVDPELQNYYNEILAVHRTWRQQKNPTFSDVILRFLVEPMREVNGRYNNLVVAETNRHLLQASHQLNSLRNLSEVKSRQFRYYSNLFKSKRRLLQVIQRILF